MGAVSDYERNGGFSRLAYKPMGPGRLYSILKLCLHALNISSSSRSQSSDRTTLDTSAKMVNGHVSEASSASEPLERTIGTLPRRLSEETGSKTFRHVRPSLGSRSVTAHPLASWSHVDSIEEQVDGPMDKGYGSDTGVSSSSPTSPTISVGVGGSLLRSSINSVRTKGSVRVLVVEDNAILRNLLIKWLQSKGYDYREAVDGLEGVRIFQSDGYFDVVLLDMSMPELDGIGATSQMRKIESARSRQAAEGADVDARVARILSLTGMSSLDDKRRAFEAGVDGYLVKPVAFKTLDSMLHKIGIS